MSGLPPFELGYPRTELRRKLVKAVLSGEKTATAGLLEDKRFFERPIEPDTQVVAVRFRVVERVGR